MSSTALPIRRLSLLSQMMIITALAFSTVMTHLAEVLPKQRPQASTFAGDLIAGALFAVTHPTSVRNLLADTVVDLIDAGAGAGTLVFQTSAAAEVATCTFSDPAFGNAASGIATANAITDDSNATGGTTDRFIIQDSNSTLVLSGSVGTAGEDINLSSLGVGVGDTVGVSSLSYAAPV
ncbi:MAG TPA: hypothetical protein PKH39_18540 [Woeseiaceae bacterium]|nr:hypothetical protein [Woeseiaceae bacterium]